jgi:hypothetical protein
MSYTVRIRRNSTMEIRQMVEKLSWEEHSKWWWTEGNFGCDCNRSLEFERASDPDFYEKPQCGQGAFTVIDVTLEDGTVIPIDGDPERDDPVALVLRSLEIKEEI